MGLAALALVLLAGYQWGRWSCSWTVFSQDVIWGAVFGDGSSAPLTALGSAAMAVPALEAGLRMVGGHEEAVFNVEAPPLRRRPRALGLFAAVASALPAVGRMVRGGAA